MILLSIRSGRLMHADRLGITGVIGIGLFLFCFSFTLGTVIPTRQEAQTLRVEEAKLVATLASLRESSEHDAVVPARLVLQSLITVPELVDQLDDLATKSGLSVEHTSYRLDDKDHLHRIEISLPLRGNYPSLRNYLYEALALDDRATLDTLSLQRTQSSDPLLDANIHLSYYFSVP